MIPTLENFSGKKAGKDFGVCMMPEFLREGSSVHDFYNPPKTVIGEFDKRSGEALRGYLQGNRSTADTDRNPDRGNGEIRR